MCHPLQKKLPLSRIALLCAACDAVNSQSRTRNAYRLHALQIRQRPTFLTISFPTWSWTYFNNQVLLKDIARSCDFRSRNEAQRSKRLICRRSPAGSTQLGKTQCAVRCMHPHAQVVSARQSETKIGCLTCFPQVIDASAAVRHQWRPRCGRRSPAGRR